MEEDWGYIYLSIKVDIISGFLGAGKTTMIKKLLEEDVLGKDIAIIENEFGDINIDPGRIEESGIEIKSISSGCICCSLAGEFDLAMRELIDEYKPNRIVIEPTGVGKLSDIIKIVNTLKKHRNVELSMVMAIVDALEYEDFIEVFGAFFRDQIKYANSVILSKTQLVDDYKVDKIVKSIREINPNGNIITTSWDELSAEEILGLAEFKKGPFHNVKFKSNYEEENKFEYWTMETAKKYDRNKLKEILCRLKEEKYGIVLRGKGILANNKGDWLDFDFLPREIEIRKNKPQTIGQIVLIGKELNKKEIEKIWD